MSKKVAILGGGVAGMSAAHELITRGFEVEIYEKQPIYAGGKARSVDVPDTNTQNPNLYLPGEHGFRFFPGFYQHLFATLKTIPFGTEGKTCFDNLVTTETMQILQTGEVPITMPLHFPESLEDIEEIFMSFLQVSKELTKEEILFFSARVWQLMTSCKDRFFDEYEQVGWWEYTEADRFSNDYRKLFVEGITRSLVAAKARLASTNTVGTIFLQLIYTMVSIKKQNTDNVLNAPTNDAWLIPWYEYLTQNGVVYNHGYLVNAINMNGDEIESVSVQNETTKEITQINADYYLLATPVEVAAQLINQDMLNADASLENIIQLSPNVEWMNGIQYYLDVPFDMHKGHTIYSDSNWALTSISQIQFWGDYDLSERYNGKVKGILSVDISDWDSLGNFNNKAAKDCTLEEIKEEVWKQLQEEINTKGQEQLTDDMLQFTYLDSDIQPLINSKSGKLESKLINEKLSPADFAKLQEVINKEPLLVNQINTWTLRPNTYTNIPNLFLASDYIKTNTNLATMEGANEAARRAVNNIITASGAPKNYCEIYKMHNPFILEILQSRDKIRWEKGLSWKKI
ncbi:hypothetical protein Fleli_1960 [Bernardetia litoralis DSM 6794]|uniref:Uncharacterized protein n=1 Tax=Bernardetia litoralis (strain ATCC 23117 / DSM 6794 / NBRC 15988 / NCIMB 1366 / Fx l1 / Sio-4) TaxID=880071 RepID=I4AK60_BERLS|nr:FAD-dependent oxidoreductase [Bernardetia litoralis]AFM04345.1 hypothetical protein Fleli_1960 [Bernardetia litoralis DSM 6794]